ncbi:sodium:solute symporter family transporter [Membranihabitans marinus]|uniref:sodium:solute symporter family transporter n=1 Tax=Membranihabitans marinus TaxID=1227546 RepID=UPI001EEE2019|nr:sodium/solute symporter [Membranihabitans marinus]
MITLKPYLRLIAILAWLIISYSPSYSQSSEKQYSQYLYKTLDEAPSFWVKVHAAEALLDNNFSIDFDEYFGEVLNTGSSENIGALRILSKINQRDSGKLVELGNEILKIFHETENPHTKLVTLESMGKLNMYFDDAEISRIASSEKGGIQTFAQWVMANGPDSSEIEKLAQHLFSTDTLQVRYASYGLRFLDRLPPSVYVMMKEAWEKMDEDHPFRIYLTSALWVHSGPEDESIILASLMDYTQGENYEKYEVFQSLARKGNETIIPQIETSFSDPDADVKVSVAQAYLANEHYLQSKVGWLDWVVLVVYASFLLGIGWFYSYYQKSKEDYFLGGGNVHPFISGISMYVSFFSAISYLAVAGEVIKYGPLMSIIVLVSAPIIFLVGSYFLIPFFMNLKMISAYEILEKPLGNRVRKLGSVIFLTTRIVWMALLIFLASKSMVVMMGWNEEVIIYITVLLGIITIVYTTMGGLKAVLVTDVIQFFILLLGAVMTIGMVAFKFGGVTNLIPDAWSDNWETIDFISFDPYVRLTIFFALINTITWWVCTTGSDQMAIQRFLSTKDLKAARQSFMVTQLGQMSIVLVLLFVGFSVLKFYDASPNLLPKGKDMVADADFLFPHFIASQFPMGMSGLVIAALFSASMSSLSSGINSTSSVLSTDLLPLLLKNTEDTNDLKYIRISSGFIGVLVVLLSLVIPYVPGNIIEVTAKTNGLFIAPLFNLFFMALFIKNPHPFGVVMGSLYGLLTAFIIAFWDVLTGNPPLSFLWIAFSSLVVAVTTSVVLSRLLSNLEKKHYTIYGFIFLLPWVLIFFYII